MLRLPSLTGRKSEREKERKTGRHHKRKAGWWEPSNRNEKKERTEEERWRWRQGEEVDGGRWMMVEEVEKDGRLRNAERIF